MVRLALQLETLILHMRGIKRSLLIKTGLMSGHLYAVVEKKNKYVVTIEPKTKQTKSSALQKHVLLYFALMSKSPSTASVTILCARNQIVVVDLT